MRSIDHHTATSTAAIALIAAALAIPAAARAQSADAPPPATEQSQPAAQGGSGNQPAIGEIGEIVVTAQFRQQRLQDTPLAITAIDAATLEARSQTRLTDITAQAPNVLLQPNPAGQGNSLRAFIRGVGQFDQSPAVEPGVGIYVDDVYFATTTGAIFDLVDLDRVEILRGPQGTLSGMNSMGGSIKLYSRKPTGEGGSAEATVGNFGRRDFRASADFTVVPDQLFARISGIYRHRDGYVTRLDYACVHPTDPFVVSGAIPRLAAGSNCKLGELGNQSVKGMRGSLRWAPDNGIEVNLNADWTKDDSETQAATLLATRGNPNVSVPYQGVPYDNRFVPFGANRGDSVINNPYVSYANFYDPGVTFRPINTAGAPDPNGRNGAFIADPASELDAWGVSGSVDIEVADNLSFRSITGFRKYDSFSSSDNDSSPVVLLQNEALFNHKQFSQEVRLNGAFFDNSLNVTVGGIYFYQRTVYFSQEDSPFAGFGTPARPTFHFIQNDPTVMKNLAGFAHATWDATDRVHLSAGLRVTNQKKDYTFNRLNLDGVTPFLPLSNPANPLNGRTGSFEGTIVDYRANAAYDLSDDAMVYAQFSTGFKGGGISPRPYFPEQVRGFGPEKLRAYEIGAKTEFFDRRLRLNGAAFYMDYSDYQATPNVCVGDDGNALPLPFGTPGLCGQYLNVADAKVKGLELEMQARPVDGLTLDGSVSYLDFKFGKPFIATGEVREGASRPGIGDFKWSFGAQYEIPLGFGGTLTPRADVYYIPGYCGNFACDPLAKVASYTLGNARLTYRAPENVWSLALEVTNLTDKLYYLNKFTPPSYVNGQPGRRREWALTLRRNF